MRIRKSFLLVLTATLSALLLAAVPARATTVPFTDEYAAGSIGLCDGTGAPITSGSIYSHAFVAAAASSRGAPDGYGQAQGGKATLYAFQPRQLVDAGEWSGYQLTGGSVFSDAAHPLAAGTNLDPSLHDFVSAYPLNWNGLLELRMYFTAPNHVPYRQTYPAAVLQVSGGRWHLVQGATNLKCDLAKVVSSERLLLPPSAFDPRHPAVTNAPAPGGASAPTIGASSNPSALAHRSGTATAGSSPAAAATGSPSPLAAKNTATVTDKTNSAWIWIGAGLIVALGVGVVVVARLRGRVDRPTR